jgi:hypothetical protein
MNKEETATATKFTTTLSSQNQQQQSHQHDHSAESGKNSKLIELFNYHLNELYLRPLLTKHSQNKAIQYEDLIQSWTLVQQWLQQYDDKSSNKSSRILLKARDGNGETFEIRYNVNDALQSRMIKKVTSTQSVCLSFPMLKKVFSFFLNSVFSNF